MMRSSGLPSTAFKTFWSIAGCTSSPSCKRGKLCPKEVNKPLSFSSLLKSGCSCTRYMNGNFNRNICSATVSLATSIHSSIIDSAKLRSRFTSLTGLPASSSLTLISGKSKSIAPRFMRRFRSTWQMASRSCSIGNIS